MYIMVSFEAKAGTMPNRDSDVLSRKNASRLTTGSVEFTSPSGRAFVGSNHETDVMASATFAEAFHRTEEETGP